MQQRVYQAKLHSTDDMKQNTDRKVWCAFEHNAANDIVTVTASTVVHIFP